MTKPIYLCVMHSTSVDPESVEIRRRALVKAPEKNLDRTAVMNNFKIQKKLTEQIHISTSLNNNRMTGSSMIFDIANDRIIKTRTPLGDDAQMVLEHYKQTYDQEIQEFFKKHRK